MPRLHKPRDSLRQALLGWRLQTEMAARERLALRVAELDEEGERSIWQMKKAELVQAAVTRLGWPAAFAQEKTTGQIRLHLKEAQQAERGQTDYLLEVPKGLNRLLKDQLQKEAAMRMIDTVCKTREEYIRAITRDVESRVAQAAAAAAPAAVPASAAKKEASPAAKAAPRSKSPRAAVEVPDCHEMAASRQKSL